MDSLKIFGDGGFIARTAVGMGERSDGGWLLSFLLLDIFKSRSKKSEKAKSTAIVEAGLIMHGRGGFRRPIWSCLRDYYVGEMVGGHDSV